MSLKWNNIKLIISDFDGVMTDNRVWIDKTGREFVCVNRADGEAIHMLRSMGVEVIIMSTETNGVVSKRAEKLRLKCLQNVTNKEEQLRKYSDENNIPLENIAYIGNDINDYGAMQLAGIKIVPCDSYEEVKNIADYVTVAKGGYGVLREIASEIRKMKDKV